MMKEKIQLLREYVVKHSKVVFPVIVIAAVALTVLLALKASNMEKVEEAIDSNQVASTQTQETEASIQRVIADMTMEENQNSEIYTLVATYYNAIALGDIDTIHTISNYLDETESIKIVKMSDFIDTYPYLQIYTKPGPYENTYIAYVYFKVTVSGYEEQMPGLKTFYICMNEEGQLYINEGEVSDDEMNYISTINQQEDVVELQNKISVEWTELCKSNPELLEYMNEAVNTANKDTGEELAAQIAAADVTAENVENAQNQEGTVATQEGTATTQEGGETVTEAEIATDATQEQTITIATATTTVNIRSSDSEQAERVGKVASGDSVTVLEQRVNGWAKVSYDGVEGYIKMEFLQIAETVDDSQVIKQVTATSNLNIRMTASETAEKIGVIAGGDSVDLIEDANGWSKIRYNGQVGYVKSEFVQ